MSFDFLGYTFRPRSSTGKNGRFTGFDLAVSDKAVKRMSETVSGWQLHRHVNLTWEQLAGWISPVIQGWMACYGKFRKSGLYSLLARINYYLRKWVRAKYKRLRPVRAMLRAWERVSPVPRSAAALAVGNRGMVLTCYWKARARGAR